MLLKKYKNILDMEEWINRLIEQLPSSIVNIVLDYHDFKYLRTKLLNNCLKDIEHLTGENCELTLSPFDMDKEDITVGKVQYRKGPFRVIMRKIYSNSYYLYGRLHEPKYTPKRYMELSGTYTDFKALQTKVNDVRLGVLSGSIVSQISGRYGSIIYGDILCD